MPTSAKPSKASELFQANPRRDAELHESILEAGDADAATAVGQAVAARLLGPERAARLFGKQPAKAKAWSQKETNAHTDWMNECVPKLMGFGKEQDVAIAACLNMWRDAWEEAHPDGAPDPGPSPPQADEKTHAIAQQLLKAYDESEHPRDDHGRWTDAGGGGGAEAAPAVGMSHEKIQAAIKNVAKYHDFDPGRIEISDGEHNFELGGTARSAAGVAYTSKVTSYGTQRPGDTLITIYSRHVTPETVEGVISHEIEHIKFQHALKRHKLEWNAVNALAVPTDDLMYADGRLKPPYDEKYPAYQAIETAFYMPSTEQFAAADGVSNYSYDWWLEQRANNATKVQTAHETLAEMARIKYESGKFPDHMGERILSWRGEDNKPSQAEIAANAKLWRDLYRAVDKVWKMPP